MQRRVEPKSHSSNGLGLTTNLTKFAPKFSPNFALRFAPNFAPKFGPTFVLTIYPLNLTIPDKPHLIYEKKM